MPTTRAAAAQKANEQKASVVDESQVITLDEHRTPEDGGKKTAEIVDPASKQPDEARSQAESVEPEPRPVPRPVSRPVSRPVHTKQQPVPIHPRQLPLTGPLAPMDPVGAGKRAATLAPGEGRDQVHGYAYKYLALLTRTMLSHRARLQAFEHRREAVEERLEQKKARLQKVLDRNPEVRFTIAPVDREGRRNWRDKIDDRAILVQKALLEIDKKLNQQDQAFERIDHDYMSCLRELEAEVNFPFFAERDAIGLEFAAFDPITAISEHDLEACEEDVRKVDDAYRAVRDKRNSNGVDAEDDDQPSIRSMIRDLNELKEERENLPYVESASACSGAVRDLNLKIQRLIAELKSRGVSFDPSDGEKVLSRTPSADRGDAHKRKATPEVEDEGEDEGSSAYEYVIDQAEKEERARKKVCIEEWEKTVSEIESQLPDEARLALEHKDTIKGKGKSGSKAEKKTQGRA